MRLQLQLTLLSPLAFVSYFVSKLIGTALLPCCCCFCPHRLIVVSLLPIGCCLFSSPVPNLLMPQLTRPPLLLAGALPSPLTDFNFVLLAVAAVSPLTALLPCHPLLASVFIGWNCCFLAADWFWLFPWSKPNNQRDSALTAFCCPCCPHHQMIVNLTLLHLLQSGNCYFSPPVDCSFSFPAVIGYLLLFCRRLIVPFLFLLQLVTCYFFASGWLFLFSFPTAISYLLLIHCQLIVPFLFPLQLVTCYFFASSWLFLFSFPAAISYLLLIHRQLIVPFLFLLQLVACYFFATGWLFFFPFPAAIG